MYRLQNLSFKIEERVLLSPLSLDFTPGKVYGLVGHNGSGKSTLLKLIARQEKPSSGEIFFADKALEDYAAKELAQNIAYLPQHLPTETHLTVQELVKMGRFAWQGLFSRDSEEDKKIVEQALELTHTTKFSQALVDNLSGGERSRVWIAMLLAQQSKFILLDEPLAPLDIAHQVEVMKLLRYLSQTLGVGIIIVIHDINLAARFCDQIIALHAGKLIFNGQAKEFISQENLKAIYGIDLTVIDHPEVEDVKVAFY